MEQKIMKYRLSVDTENGSYWHGERQLRTQTQIDALIKPTINTQTSVDRNTARGQTKLHYYCDGNDPDNGEVLCCQVAQIYVNPDMLGGEAITE